MSREPLESAIEALYDAALGDTSWDVAVEAIVNAHQGKRAILFTPTVAMESGGLWALHDVPKEIQSRYVHEYREQDLWLARGTATGAFRAGNTVLGQDLVRADELKRTAIYADVLRDARLFHLCSTIVFDGTDPTLPPALFAMFRSEEEDAFTRRDQQRFSQTGRHVSRAMRLWFRSQRPTGGAQALAHAIEAPALVVRLDMRITWMNRTAEQWQRDGRLRVQHDCLVEIQGYRANLKIAVQDAACGRMSQEVSTSDPGRAVEFAPARSGRSDALPCSSVKEALIVIRDNAAGASTKSILMTRYRLTQSEANLAIALANGASIAEYAPQHGVSLGTVRTHLKALLSKTNTRRQAEAVSLVSRMRPLLISEGADG